jgi:hypothetical protein
VSSLFLGTLNLFSLLYYSAPKGRETTKNLHRKSKTRILQDFSLFEDAISQGEQKKGWKKKRHLHQPFGTTCLILPHESVWITETSARKK